MPQTTAPISSRLKELTQDLHTRAERHPFQRAMIAGRLGREGYSAYLGQMLHIHAALDAALESARPRHPLTLGALARDYHYRVDQLAADLAHLGYEKPAPSRGAGAFVRWIREIAADPASLIGILYVLEGSTNGGRYIAKAVRRTLSLTDAGTAYLDPHGAEQEARWARFKADLDALPLRDDDAATAIAAAKRTFEAVISVADDLGEPLAVEPVPSPAITHLQ